MRKAGSCWSASTTSTLLKSMMDVRVPNVASSSTLGRMTSLRYPMRYVWWILARIAGS